MEIEWVIEPTFDFYLGYCNEVGITQVRQDNKWGLINMNAEFVLPCISEQALNYFGDNLINPMKEGKYGVYTFDMKEVEPCIYRSAWINAQRTGCVLDGGDNWGHSNFIDGKGRIVNKPNTVRSFNTKEFSEGLMSVEIWNSTELTTMRGTSIGYMDENGEFPLPMIYIYNQPFYNGIAATALQSIFSNNGNYKRLYINKKGETLFECPENWLGNSSFTGKYAWVHIHKGSGNYSKLGIINTNYELMFEPHEWTAGIGLTDDFCFFSKATGSGVIDTQGNIIVPFEYGSVSQLTNNLFVVSGRISRNRYKYSIFDAQQQRLVLPMTYQSIGKYIEGYIFLSKNGRLSCMDYNLNTIPMPFQYDALMRFVDNVAWANVGGKWGLLKVIL